MIHYKSGNKSLCGITLDRNLHSINKDDINCPECNEKLNEEHVSTGKMVINNVEYKIIEGRRDIYYYCEFCELVKNNSVCSVCENLKEGFKLVKSEN